MQYPPDWAGTPDKPSRWRRLDQLDKMLDGTFYDHLTHHFYNETMAPAGSRVPMMERRPSTQYNLPSMVAAWSARKLWAGRHVPRIHHSEKSVTETIDQLVQTTKFYQMMTCATILGSVGSVAMTFLVSKRSDEEPQVALKVWRAKFCTPQFDDFCNLTSLKIHYQVLGQQLIAQGILADVEGEAIRPDQQYWFIRVYGTQDEQTLIPPKIDDWNPVTGWKRRDDPKFSDRPIGGDKSVSHGLGFVPGVWIRNLPGSDDAIDGKGTWEAAKGIKIEIDYLLSQASRGTRYNCSPELTIVGEFAGAPLDERSPAQYIHLKAGIKDETGVAFGEGKAFLLEMSGAGIKAAQDQVDKLRNIALEMIGATRKDPEKLKGVMSGRAMEFLDEDSHDLVMDLRSSYGDAALELFRKIVRALKIDGADPKGLKLDWPRLYQPTPEDLAHLIPALVMAATPIQEPLSAEDAAKMDGGGEGGGEDDKGEGGGDDSDSQQVRQEKTVTHKGVSGASHTVKQATTTGPAAQGGRPSVKPTGGKVLGALLEVEEASEFLKMYMDIDLLPDAESKGVSDSDEPQGEKTDPMLDPEPPEGGGARAGNTDLDLME
jgi:hypothetical protein